MDNFNKVLSFILGLVVVIVFFAVLTGRLSLKKSFPFISTKTTSTEKVEVTPTPTPVSSVVVSSKTTATSPPSSSYNRYQTTNKTPSSIPSTGSPTIFLPLFISTLGVGIFLRRKV